ncbi:DUF1799 domain-containing protein [Pseudacidovorax sp. RU35E]|uniref:DUF1799 domain-containing protein n=1 Tax=Pseudacidovorax sp. RU35E TaxID=1907403 RepID=UPI00095477F1|nr:DUF1799 domain-containing protein [Pseudacidovorax sp. RU35E]SIQ99769.1 Phage related hypothetical protein [Pseudacidovorax sp. RU35E]
MPGPTPEAAAVWGLTLEEASGDPYDIWPDNAEIFRVFAEMETQWNVGFAGATGLKYESLPIVLRMLGIPRATWPDLFQGLRIMESTALRYYAHEREQNRPPESPA